VDVSKPAGAALFARMQSLAVWFIETASMVDAEDTRWTPLALFCETSSGERVLGGFCSLYEFTNPINQTQPHSLRVCQFLVLPHLRKESPTRAQHLLQTVYNLATARSDVSQVTAESPNAAFTRLRDVVDCARILALKDEEFTRIATSFAVPEKAVAQDEAAPCQQDEPVTVQTGIEDGQTRAESLPVGVVKRISERLKTTKRQVRRCFDIVRLEALQKRRQSALETSGQQSGMWNECFPDNVLPDSCIICSLALRRHQTFASIPTRG
jgi:hypothetical protein